MRRSSAEVASEQRGILRQKLELSRSRSVQTRKRTHTLLANERISESDHTFQIAVTTVIWKDSTHRQSRIRYVFPLETSTGRWSSAC